MRSIALFVILLPVIAHAKQEMTYKIPVSYGDVVVAVERLANEPRTKPFKVPNLPALIEGKDVVVETYIRPSIRYYRVRLHLERPIGRLCRFDKTIEVWGKPDHYVIKSSVEIGWADFHSRIANRIKDRVVGRAECMVLTMERCKIEDYAKRIGTPEVEHPDSWLLIIADAWDVGVRAYKEIVDAVSRKHEGQREKRSVLLRAAGN